MTACFIESLPPSEVNSSMKKTLLPTLRSLARSAMPLLSAPLSRVP